jgi:hypothetical protein
VPSPFKKLPSGQIGKSGPNYFQMWKPSVLRLRTGLAERNERRPAGGRRRLRGQRRQPPVQQ